MLDALADQLGFLIVSHLAHRPAHARTKDIASALGVMAPEVSKRILRLEVAGVILRGREHMLIDQEQTRRMLREINRLSISLQRWHLHNEERVFTTREYTLARGQLEPLPGLDARRLAASMRWQATDEEGILVLGPDEGILIDEDAPRAVLNHDYLPFRMLVAGLTAGDLHLDRRAATHRAKRAIEELVPPANYEMPISRFGGWRDATEQVYRDPELPTALRRYLPTGDTHEPRLE
jgi:Mn-dependent DtxR family transcriptional regulator